MIQIVYTSSDLYSGWHRVAPPYYSWQLVPVVLLLGPILGPLLPMAPLCPVSPLPVVLLTPTFLRPLRLLVRLVALLLLVLLSALLHLHFQADYRCWQHSLLRLSHVSCHHWCHCRCCLTSVVTRPVHPFYRQWELWYHCLPHYKDCW